MKAARSREEKRAEKERERERERERRLRRQKNEKRVYCVFVALFQQSEMCAERAGEGRRVSASERCLYQ